MGKADGESNRQKSICMLSFQGLAVYLISWRFTARPRARLNSLNIDLVLLLDVVCMLLLPILLLDIICMSLLLIINVTSMHTRAYSLQILQHTNAYGPRICL